MECQNPIKTIWRWSLPGESEYIDSNPSISFQMEKVFLLRLHVPLDWNDLDRILPRKYKHILYFYEL